MSDTVVAPPVIPADTQAINPKVDAETQQRLLDYWLHNNPNHGNILTLTVWDDGATVWDDGATVWIS